MNAMEALAFRQASEQVRSLAGFAASGLGPRASLINACSGLRSNRNLGLNTMSSAGINHMTRLETSALGPRSPSKCCTLCF